MFSILKIDQLENSFRDRQSERPAIIIIIHIILDYLNPFLFYFVSSSIYFPASWNGIIQVYYKYLFDIVYKLDENSSIFIVVVVVVLSPVVR